MSINKCIFRYSFQMYIANVLNVLDGTDNLKHTLNFMKLCFKLLTFRVNQPYEKLIWSQESKIENFDKKNKYNIYCMSNKSCPNLYSNLQYEMSQNFLVMQYVYCVGQLNFEYD